LNTLANITSFQFRCLTYPAKRNLDRQFFVDYNLTENKPLYSWWISLCYDAFLLPALAACSIEKDFFTNDELFHAIAHTEFQGASGYVRLAPDKQTRDPSSVRYAMSNMLIDNEASVDGKVRFKARVATFIDFSQDNPTQRVNPFIYADNSTTPPNSLPPLEVNQNLISQGIRTTGLVLCGLVIFVSLAWIIFSYYYRHRKFVRGSQPPFLYMVCVGVILMATAIIPMSLQEPVSQQGLDIACMSSPWLFSAGFT